jgi:hypothetical protein
MVEVNNEIARNLTEPWAEGFYLHRARQFLKWKKARDQRIRSHKASLGGKAKHAKRVAKSEAVTATRGSRKRLKKVL